MQPFDYLIEYTNRLTILSEHFSHSNAAIAHLHRLANLYDLVRWLFLHVLGGLFLQFLDALQWIQGPNSGKIADLKLTLGFLQNVLKSENFSTR